MELAPRLEVGPRGRGGERILDGTPTAPVPPARWVCASCGGSVGPEAGLQGLARCSGCDRLGVDPAATGIMLPGAALDPEGRAGLLVLDEAFRVAYRLESLLGTGAHGVVFSARQQGVDRRVAIKFLADRCLPEALGRFRREGTVLGGLRSPGLVRVYDFGQTDSTPYLVQEYLEGGSLRQLLARVGRLPLPRTCELALPCLLGLDECHRAGLVHRDVKPENVLLTAEGAAKLGDFGLVLAPGDGRRLTRQGQLLGTPRSLAPELIQGRPATPASDLYAVGVMLYEMLTGTFPFGSAATPELLWQHAMEPPTPPREYLSDLPVAANNLILRCLAKDPAHRPPGARELADGLGRILESAGSANGPVTVRLPLAPPGPALPPGQAPGAVPPRWSRFAVLAGLGALAYLASVQPWSQGPEPGSPSPFRREVSARLSGPDGLALGATAMVEPRPFAVAASPDGRLLASAGRRRFAVSVWDLATGSCRERVAAQPPSFPGALCFSPDSRALLVAWVDGSARVHDLGGPADADSRLPPLPAGPEGKAGYAAGWLASRRPVVVGLVAGRLWVSMAGEPAALPLPLPDPAPELLGFRLDAATAQAMAVDQEGSFRIWDLARRRLVHTYPRMLRTEALTFASQRVAPAWAWDAESGRIAGTALRASKAEAGEVLVLDLATGRALARWQVAAYPLHLVESLYFAEHGRKLVSRIYGFGLSSDYEWRDLGHPDEPESIVRCSDWPACEDPGPAGDPIAYVNRAGRIRRVSRAGPEAGAEPPATRPGPADAITAISFLPDGTRLVTAAADRTLRLWDLAEAQAVGEPLALSTAVTSIALLPDGGGVALFAAGREVGQVGFERLGRPAPAPQVRAGPAASEQEASMRSLLGDRESAASFGLDPARDNAGFPLEGARAPGELRISTPEGRWMITGGSDGTISIRDDRAGGAPGVVRGRLAAPCTALALGPRAELLAAGGADGEVRIWTVP